MQDWTGYLTQERQTLSTKVPAISLQIWAVSVVGFFSSKKEKPTLVASTGSLRTGLVSSVCHSRAPQNIQQYSFWRYVELFPGHFFQTSKGGNPNHPDLSHTDSRRLPHCKGSKADGKSGQKIKNVYSRYFILAIFCSIKNHLRVHLWDIPTTS